jgi:uncharacterized surface protein with fasciclin (FAS1) repeats
MNVSLNTDPPSKSTYMSKSLRNLISGAVCMLALSSALAQTTPAVIVGGAAMDPLKGITDNLLHSKEHTALVATIRAADLGGTLNGAGPFTVFAPTNEAFNKLSPDTTDDWLKPENKAQAIKVLSYHIVAGKIGTKTLLKMIKKSKGKAALKTMEGDNIYATQEGDNIVIWDESGNKSTITIGDVWQKNGVIHVIDTVLLPK